MEKTLGAAWTIDTKNAWVESLEMASTAMMHSQFEREAPITPVYLQPEPLPVEQQDWVRLTWQTIARDLKGNGIVLMKGMCVCQEHMNQCFLSQTANGLSDISQPL